MAAPIKAYDTSLKSDSARSEDITRTSLTGNKEALDTVVHTTTGSPIAVVSEPYAIRLDDVGSGVTYVGYALPGTATSVASWQVKRLTETSGDCVVEWADGDADFNNIWDDRAGLSYS